MANGTLATTTKLPLFLVLTRLSFVGYFLAAFWFSIASNMETSQLEFIWVIYLLALYFGAEWLYSVFMRQGIDLSYGMPLLFAVYCLNLSTLLSGGQEKFALLNRVEHMASFVLLTYVVWIFFTKYLPQSVWVEHPYYTALLTFAITALAGVINEHVELLFDYLFKTKLVGSKWDTSLDLVMNSLGSALFLGTRLLLGVVDDPRRKNNPAENRI